jgi:hypothetical protein
MRAERHFDKIIVGSGGIAALPGVRLSCAQPLEQHYLGSQSRKAPYNRQ